MIYINAVFTVVSFLWLFREVAGAERDLALWFALAFTLLCAANTINLLGGRRRPARASRARRGVAARPGQPLVDRPDVPAAYGVLDAGDGAGLMAWPDVSRRLAAPANYWICTTRPDGRPHSTPVWGVWLDDIFYFGTHRHSVKAHNLAANPYLTLHLDSSDDVVVVEGPVEEIVDRHVKAQIDDAMVQKYDLDDGAQGEEQNPVYSMRPALALAWSGDELGATATRWTFGQ